MKKVVHAVCPHDCPDACGVLITVRGWAGDKDSGRSGASGHAGIFVREGGEVSGPGVLAGSGVVSDAKGWAEGAGGGAAELRSAWTAGGTGPHTSTLHKQTWQRISWDEALDEITSRFRGISAEFGSEAILPYSFGGTLGALNSASMDRRFFHRLGASQLDRAICSAAGEAGLQSVLGVKLGTEPEQFRHSKYIIAWASNIHANNVHLWPFIAEARRNGAKLVVIDPFRTRTAECADWYLPINPGTDAALALAMMHVIIGEGLHDADYVAKYTLGFEQLREKVKEYPPERVAQWTGISAADIRKLAHGICHGAAVGDPAELRRAALRARRDGDASDRDAAVRDWIMEGSWRRVADVDQRSGRHSIPKSFEAP